MNLQIDPIQGAGGVATILAAFFGGGKFWEAWLRNRGQMQTRQADEIADFRKEQRAQIEELRAELKLAETAAKAADAQSDAKITSLESAVRSVQADMAQSLLSQWIYREKTRHLISLIRQNNPFWHELAVDIERDDHGLDALMDKYGISVHHTATYAGKSDDGAKLAGCRVLIADDYPDTLKLIQAIVSDEPYETVTVESGFEALEQYHQARANGRPFSLLVLDQRMTGMTGEEVSNAIRGIGDDATKIVFLTAVPEQLAVGTTEVIDGDGVWRKPLMPDLLKLKIRAALVSTNCAQPAA